MTKLTLLVAFLCIPCRLAGGGHFDYRPGSKWGGVCESGKRQSPVNIDNAEADGKLKIITLGTLETYSIFFTGVNFEVEFENEDFSTPPEVYIPANNYTIGDSKRVKPGQMLKIELVQFHFHTYSEHTVDADYDPSELHIVCKIEDGQSDYCDREGPCYAVFGVMLMYPSNLEGGNPMFDHLVKEVPKEEGREHAIKITESLNIDDMLPEKKDYYTYLGSLTTPPCTESVTWFVFQQSVELSLFFVSQHQYIVSYTPGQSCTFDFFGKCYPPREKTDSRVVQPLNGRTVYSVVYDKPEAAAYAV